MDYEPKHDPAYYNKKGYAHFQNIRMAAKKAGDQQHRFAQLYEIGFPREFFVAMADRFTPIPLKQKHSTGRLMKLRKDSLQNLYDQFKDFHNNEISRRSWYKLLKHGLSFRITNHSGVNYAVCTPGTLFHLQNHLDKIPYGGGLYFDGSRSEIINSMKLPEVNIKKDVKVIKPETIKEEVPGPVPQPAAQPEPKAAPATEPVTGAEPGKVIG